MGRDCVGRSESFEGSGHKSVNLKQHVFVSQCQVQLRYSTLRSQMKLDWGRSHTQAQQIFGSFWRVWG